MRNVLLYTLILIGSSALCQPAIPLEKAVLEQGTTLAPDRLSRLQWLAESDQYCFVKEGALVIASAEGKGAERVTMEDLGKAASELERFPSVHWLDDQTFWFRSGNAYLKHNRKNGSTEPWLVAPDNASNMDLHASTGQLAYTRGNNLFVQSGNQEAQVTDLEEQVTAGQAIARYEFGIGKGTFWSPNGKRLAFYQKDERHVQEYPLTDYSTVPATVDAIKYPMAGSHSEYASVGIYTVGGGKPVYLDFSRFGSGDAFYATNVSWSPDGRFVLVAVVNRAQDEMNLVQFDAGTGHMANILYTEKDARYVEPEHPAIFLPDGKSFLWFSQQSGYNNLKHFAYPSGQLLKESTAEFPITDLLGMDAKGKWAFVQATGKDNTQSHVFRLDLKKMALTQLTSNYGQHRGIASPTGKYVIDTYSNLETPRVTEVLNSKGRPVQTLLESKDPLTDFAHGKPEIFEIESFDGQPLWCRLIKPSDFDPTKRYPVVVYVYNGPHVQLVTKRWMGGAPLWMYTLAETGCLVFTVDGRGSANRGKEFEQVIHRNLGKVEVMDQKAGVNWLKQQTFVNSSRMAVHGWSYGGFMTTSMMLKEPGLFKVGVAGGPVIDWSYYEAMYTERYMDTPTENPEGFRRSDLKELVRELDGKLLMIHGNQDDVVLPQHNVDFQKACIDAGIQVDFYLYPGHAHNVRGKDRVHLMQKVFDYIKASL